VINHQLTLLITEDELVFIRPIQHHFLCIDLFDEVIVIPWGRTFNHTLWYVDFSFSHNLSQVEAEAIRRGFLVIATRKLVDIKTIGVSGDCGAEVNDAMVIHKRTDLIGII